MQKAVLVVTLVLISMLAQILFVKLVGPSFTPNFVLIAVVFFNLARGVRYSLAAAFLGGFLLDSFSGHSTGINTFSLVMCAFVTVWVKRYIYQPGVAESRVILMLFIALLNSALQFAVHRSAASLEFPKALWSAMLPEIFWTTAAAEYTFERLKQCVLRFLA